MLCDQQQLNANTCAKNKISSGYSKMKRQRCLDIDTRCLIPRVMTMTISMLHNHNA